MKYLDRAEPASPHGIEHRMPAEMGNIEAEGEAGLEKVLSFVDFIRLVVNVNSDQRLPPRALFFMDMPFKISPEILERTLERLYSSRSQSTEGMTGA